MGGEGVCGQARQKGGRHLPPTPFSFASRAFALAFDEHTIATTATVSDPPATQTATMAMKSVFVMF